MCSSIGLMERKSPWYQSFTFAYFPLPEMTFGLTLVLSIFVSNEKSLPFTANNPRCTILFMRHQHKKLQPK